MKKASRILCLILALVVLFCITASAEEPSVPPEPSGQLGDNVYYTYDKDASVVRIYGSGSTWDYYPSIDDGSVPPDYWIISPLQTSLGDLNKIVIEDGVTSLGSYLFYGCKSTQIQVAASVESIDIFTFILSNSKSIYFYGDAPSIKVHENDERTSPLFRTKSVYRLPDAKGWDEFEFLFETDINCYDGCYLPAKAQTFCGAPYCDVAGDAWCAKAVLRMWDEGIMNGTAIDVFSPNASLTRGMIAAILYRMADEPEFSGKAGSAVFSDVKKDSFCDAAVGWAYANGIIEGYTDGSFKPNRALNRQELAALLYRYDAKSSPATTTDAQSESGDALNAADAADWDTVSEFAKAPLTWAVKEGVINGTDSSKLVLDPFGTATRAQIAVILDRYLSLG